MASTVENVSRVHKEGVWACVCVCVHMVGAIRAPTGVPLLHLLCEYSLGGGGKVWRDLADQCWKSCPHAALVTHSQLLLTGLEDARIPGRSLACSTDKAWLLLCRVGDFPIPCPALRCSAKLAPLFLSPQPTQACIHTQPPAIHPACRKHSLGSAIITQPGRNHPPTPLPSQQSGCQFLATELADMCISTFLQHTIAYHIHSEFCVYCAFSGWSDCMYVIFDRFLSCSSIHILSYSKL